MITVTFLHLIEEVSQFENKTRSGSSFFVLLIVLLRLCAFLFIISFKFLYFSISTF